MSLPIGLAVGLIGAKNVSFSKPLPTDLLKSVATTQRFSQGLFNGVQEPACCRDMAIVSPVFDKCQGFS
jgi:hypothetical protein